MYYENVLYRIHSYNVYSIIRTSLSNASVYYSKPPIGRRDPRSKVAVGAVDRDNVQMVGDTFVFASP